MKRNFPGLYTIELLFYSLILNIFWEFIQCFYLFDMWSWGLLKASLVMWLAIVGDVFIIIFIIFISSIIVGSSQIFSLELKAVFIVLIISIFASIILELSARALQL